MTRRRTRGEIAIEAQLKTLSPDSKRYQVLVSARNFKAAWVELGEHLTEVRERELFLGWGHTSFEAYCRREVHIKGETAIKLTRSFSFLRDHEPTVLSERTRREVPPLDVVDLLSQARERSSISDQDFRSLRQEVFSGGEAPTKGQVVRRLREIDPDAFKPALRAVASGNPDMELRKALLLAERLQATLEAVPGISRETMAGVKHTVRELKSLFAARESKKQSA